MAMAGWYAIWRILEPRLPDWLTRVVLGSAVAPSYLPVGAMPKVDRKPIAQESARDERARPLS